MRRTSRCGALVLRVDCKRHIRGVVSLGPSGVRLVPDEQTTRRATWCVPQAGSGPSRLTTSGPSPTNAMTNSCGSSGGVTSRGGAPEGHGEETPPPPLCAARHEFEAEATPDDVPEHFAISVVMPTRHDTTVDTTADVERTIGRECDLPDGARRRAAPGQALGGKRSGR